MTRILAISFESLSMIALGVADETDLACSYKRMKEGTMGAHVSDASTAFMPSATGLAALFIGVMGCAVLMPHQARAQNYPTKAIRVVVPFALGGPADLLARVVAPKLSAELGQPVIVDNKPGGSTAIGVDLVVKSRPDGHTLLIGSLSLALNVASGRKMPYDPIQDLAPISLAFTQSYLLVVNASTPISSVKDLIAYAKANPQKVVYGSTGVGGPGHLASELFRTRVGVELTHVPYKGAAQPLLDLISGLTQMSITGITPALPHVKSGRLRALAITSEKRSALVPDVPTMLEAGIPDFVAGGWYGLLAPARTPVGIVVRLNRDMLKILGMQDVIVALGTQVEIQTSTPEEFGRLIQGEIKRWRGVIQASNISLSDN